MRLINTTTLELKEFFDTSQTPAYAILSHCWGEDEVSLKQFMSEKSRHGTGWRKIHDCCSIARSHQIRWAWVDTCCIDKTSTAELQEAINSMYRWYERAAICYAFLSDFSWSGPSREEGLSWKDSVEVSRSDTLHEEATLLPNKQNSDRQAVLRSAAITSASFEEVWLGLETCRWFKRGWTLQELIAPSEVLFYDCDGKLFGSRSSMSNILTRVTRIAPDYLMKRKHVTEASAACRMSWASERVTTRKEDLAYCLLGLFDINLPLLYGEGENAFVRLQETIIESIDDQSIFAWTYDEDKEDENDHGMRSMLARGPSNFRLAGYFVPTRNDRPPIRLTSRGLELQYPITRLGDLMMTFPRFRVFDLRPFGMNLYKAPRIRYTLECASSRYTGFQDFKYHIDLAPDNKLPQWFSESPAVDHLAASPKYIRVSSTPSLFSKSRADGRRIYLLEAIERAIMGLIFTLNPSLARYQIIYVERRPRGLTQSRPSTYGRTIPVNQRTSSIRKAVLALILHCLWRVNVSFLMSIGIAIVVFRGNATDSRMTLRETTVLWALLTLGYHLASGRISYLLFTFISWSVVRKQG